MNNVDKMNALTEEFSAKFEHLEARWVALHQQAQDSLDALGVVGVVPLEGLREWVTKGLDESFECATDKLNAAFDAACEALDAKD